MSIQGLPQLRRKLADFPEVAEREIRKAMEKGATDVVATARSFVPVESGRLRDSIGWTWGEAPRGSLVLARSSRTAAGDRLTIYAGNDAAYYARWIEFGTVAMSAQPFFFPSWRTHRKRIKSRNTRAIRVAAKKVAGHVV